LIQASKYVRLTKKGKFENCKVKVYQQRFGKGEEKLVATTKSVKCFEQPRWNEMFLLM